MILSGLAMGVIVFCLIMASGLYMYNIGYKAGSITERHRCEKIVRQSWEVGGKMSPTARRIYCSVVDGREDLITENEFWG